MAIYCWQNPERVRMSRHDLRSRGADSASIYINCTLKFRYKMYLLDIDTGTKVLAGTV